ncbi:MAG: hypothetical protein KJZ74_12500 [Gemmatimonadales bacterium]|nr:hypothetical protein [Gemmatimonadota bacterium]MCL4214722.1 hypothetical protein [Gemmatimonadales bacterium]
MLRIRTALVAIASLALASTVALAAIARIDFSGTWQFSVVTDNGTGTPTVTLKQEGTKITGTYSSQMMGLRALEGSAKGDSLRFVLSNGGNADAPTLTYIGVATDANTLKGIVDFGGMGGATFTAVRKQ